MLPRFVLFSIPTLAVGFVSLAAAELPTGTQLHIRLSRGVNSADVKPRQPVEAVLISPILVDGGVVLAAGSKVLGQVKEVKQAGTSHEQALLDLQFQSIQDQSGKSKAKIDARLVEVENARETIDTEGRIVGIDASKTASSRLDQGINKLTERYPGLGELLGATKSAVVKEADPNITYDPGVEITLELTKPLVWNFPTPPLTIRPVEPESGLAVLANRQPMQTMASSPSRPSDLTDIMFIGSRQDLERAFQAAGWATAAKLDESSKLETFRAVVELRGYKEAPMSTLLLEGQPPDLVFQKQNNTFAQRHHLRIWRRPERFNGKDVWVCAATHDVGIDFSQENHTFIHRVDPHIDLERAKVVGDLLYTNLVKAVSLVERPAVPRDGHNATGDPFETDGRMAVLEF